MTDFFNTIYYYTNSLYGQNLDNYLYQTSSGYLHNGLVMLVVTIIASVLYYYLFKPVRRQYFWWFVTFAVAAVINFIFSIWYTATPLINNEVDSQSSWSGLDCFFFGVSNIIWTFAFYVVISFFIKWKSPCKYIPFCKF